MIAFVLGICHQIAQHMKIKICSKGLVISAHMLIYLHAYIIYINQLQELLRSDSLFVVTKIRIVILYGLGKNFF